MRKPLVDLRLDLAALHDGMVSIEIVYFRSQYLKHATDFLNDSTGVKYADD